MCKFKSIHFETAFVYLFFAWQENLVVSIKVEWNLKSADRNYQNFLSDKTDINKCSLKMDWFKLTHTLVIKTTCSLLLILLDVSKQSARITRFLTKPLILMLVLNSYLFFDHAIADNRPEDITDKPMKCRFKTTKTDEYDLGVCPSVRNTFFTIRAGLQ